jgi:SAM-dependent methyltransferase
VLPFANGSFDAVVSTSCLEHTPFFWLAFLEQVRVLAPGGHLYASAPSNGWYHGYPFDHWRFYPDAGLALEAWARRSGQELALVESFVGAQTGSIWNDFVMIFERNASAMPRGSFVVDAFAGAHNVRRFDREGLENVEVQTEDERRIGELEMKNFVLGKRLREGKTS